MTVDLFIDGDTVSGGSPSSDRGKVSLMLL